LADTTKSGQLLFPEFALAMYLCNLALNGKSLPTSLPERVKNEVSSMVDIISFSIPDEQSAGSGRTNAPSFDNAPKAAPQSAPQQPSNAQILSQLAPPPTGFQPQSTGFMSQPTGYLQSQPTGYGMAVPLQSMPTGFPPQAAPLNAQPTGRPGQWGLVNAPSAGLPNLDALQAQMMPQIGREAGFSATGLRGNATVPWAVTKDEKKIYDNMFRAWDGFNKNYITGTQALEIFGQSGLPKPDLEKVWTLSDPHNKGRLDLDEFAVAMHLIYRALNGYPVPDRLPAELVPPSTRNLNDSLGSIRSLLSRDAEDRKSSTNYLEPQRTGVSYLKNHSFRDAAGPSAGVRKDGTVYKHNDESSGYRSSARRRVNANDRSSSPDQPGSPSSETSEDLTLEQLKKKVREKQVILDAIDFQAENNADQDAALDRKDRHEADELFERIRRIQGDIDSHPKAALRSTDSDAERRNTLRTLRGLQDRVPELASHARKAEQAIFDARLELFRLKDSKANPGSAPPIVGSGPGGAVTEGDRLRARAKAMMQARSAALAGKPIADDSNAAAVSTRRLEEEKSKTAAEKESNERMIRDVEDGITTFSKELEDSLKEGGSSAANDHEKRRWQEGLGVEDEVREFIYDLQRSSRSARVRREDTSRSSTTAAAPAARTESPATRTTTSQASGSYSNYKTAEDRAAFIKQQAEQRMAERLAALGISRPSKAGGAETTQQRQEREQKEKEERKRQAEAEDASREQERQRRLQDEQITPPSASKKAPPPAPIPRNNKGRSDSVQGQDKAILGAAELKQEERVQDAKVNALE